MQPGTQLQMAPLTPMVKKLIIVNVAIWLVFQVIIEQYFLTGAPLTSYLSLRPAFIIEKFYVWQFFTWMFLHSLSITHIVFNMLMLWFFGGELEQRWGAKFFLTYYLVSGVGAAFVYVICMAVYSVVTGAVDGLYAPVVGASGAIFGVLLAYGILFGERTILFFFVFPMKVKFFVMIIGAIEVVSLLNVGQSNVANLAHLGGLVSGYLFLIIWTKKQQKKRAEGKGKRKGRGNLRLVVNNDQGESDDKNGPKYWN